MRKSANAAGDSMQFVLTAILLVAAVVLGGGQGGLGDTGLQLFSLALLGYLFAGPATRNALLTKRSPAWMVLLFLVVPIMQLLPIPASMWNSIGARVELAGALSAVGLSPTPRVGLQPIFAERALWTLLPAVAVYLSALALSPTRQHQLLRIVVVMGVLCLFLGIMQLAGGPDSPLRFYTMTNRVEAVGFFANRNHMASLLAMTLPLAMATVAFAMAGDRDGKINAMRIAFAIGTVMLLILGIALTRSRAGLLLGMAGLLLSIPLVLSFRTHRGAKRIFAVVVALSIVLTVQFAMYGVLQRLQADPLEDARWQIGQLTAEAARKNAPLGSGSGTFRQVFQTLDTESPGQAIVNHAHNDYLELWLEAGWAFFALSAVFGAIFAWATFRAWFSGDSRASAWPKAASIAILLVLLHSAIDYPLRTTGIEAVFGLLLAVLLSWSWKPTSGKGTP